jgi:membrane protein YqaA with SNARE-associated domain
MTSLEQPGAAEARARARAGPPRPPSAAVRALAALHRLAEAGWAATAVAAWALLQGSVVPGPVDGVIVPLGLADPRRVWQFAWSALVGSTLGALVAYTIGAVAFEGVGRTVLGWLGVGTPEIEQVRGMFQEKGIWLVLLSTVTPLSTKFVAIAAGAFGIPVIPFLGAIAAGRALRYSVVAVVVRYFGDRTERFVESRYGQTLDDIANEGRARRGAGRG